MDKELREIARMANLLERQMLNDQFDRTLWQSMHKRFQDWQLAENVITPETRKAFDKEISNGADLGTIVFSEYSENLDE